MGIPPQNAEAIIRSHKNEPIRGQVLCCGRQSVKMTPSAVAEMLKSHGLEPLLSPAESVMDTETRLGGEGKPQRDGTWISDHSFFKMLGVDVVRFLDHSDYEGADLIADLNQPLPLELEGQFDFVIDGGTLDNVWNPSQAIMNLSRMLRPGGRLLTYNFYANFRATYTNLPQQWYIDYFALNRFAFAQTYFSVYDGGGTISVYQANHAKRAASRQIILNFPPSDPSIGIGLMSYAVKAEDSTWDRQPSQECYRDEKEWQEIEPIFARFAKHGLRVPILRSTATRPINMVGGDDFQYISVNEDMITEQHREPYDQLMRSNVLSAIRKMDKTFSPKPWGILETGKLFYQLVAQSEEARRIIAQDNVTLFDIRMLLDVVSIGGVQKSISPAANLFTAEMPILIICADPETDAMWKRVARMFRHLKLFSACHSQESDAGLVDFARFGAVNFLPTYQSSENQKLATATIPKASVPEEAAVEPPQVYTPRGLNTGIGGYLPAGLRESAPVTFLRRVLTSGLGNR